MPRVTRKALNRLLKETDVVVLDGAQTRVEIAEFSSKMKPDTVCLSVRDFFDRTYHFTKLELEAAVTNKTYLQIGGKTLEFFKLMPLKIT